MFAKDMKVLMASGSIKDISDVSAGYWVKTINGDRKVVSVSKGEDFFSKFILSDGSKFLVSDAQKFLTPERTWISVSKIKEGTILRMPGNNSVKVIDITPIQSMEGYNLVIEDDGSYIIYNGLSCK